MILESVCIKIMCFFPYIVRVALAYFTHGFHGDGHEVEETLQVQI